MASGSSSFIDGRDEGQQERRRGWVAGVQRRGFECRCSGRCCWCLGEEQRRRGLLGVSWVERLGLQRRVAGLQLRAASAWALDAGSPVEVLRCGDGCSRRRAVVQAWAASVGVGSDLGNGSNGGGGGVCSSRTRVRWSFGGWWNEDGAGCWRRARVAGGGWRASGTRRSHSDGAVQRRGDGGARGQRRGGGLVARRKEERGGWAAAAPGDQQQRGTPEEDEQ